VQPAAAGAASPTRLHSYSQRRLGMWPGLWSARAVKIVEADGPSWAGEP
jgi:hypothetical protein